MKSAPRVLVRRKPVSWQCAFCWIVWLLLPVTGVIFFSERSGPRVIREIAQWLNQFSELMEMYLGIAFFALALLALKVCLHDWVTTGGKERVFISDDGLKRTATSSFLSIFTDLMSDLSLRQWDIGRTSIDKLVVKINEKNFDMSVMEISYPKGSVWLRLTEWVYDKYGDTPDDFLREMRRTNRPKSLEEIKQLPLIKELIDRNYPVEFVRQA